MYLYIFICNEESTSIIDIHYVTGRYIIRTLCIVNYIIIIEKYIFHDDDET